jgi:hypothetical protein
MQLKKKLNFLWIDVKNTYRYVLWVHFVLFIAKRLVCTKEYMELYTLDAKNALLGVVGRGGGEGRPVMVVTGGVVPSGEAQRVVGAGGQQRHH